LFHRLEPPFVEDVTIVPAAAILLLSPFLPPSTPCKPLSLVINSAASLTLLLPLLELPLLFLLPRGLLFDLTRRCSCRCSSRRSRSSCRAA
jgi:hypothetical protein